MLFFLMFVSGSNLAVHLGNFSLSRFILAIGNNNCLDKCCYLTCTIALQGKTADMYTALQSSRYKRF